MSLLYHYPPQHETLVLITKVQYDKHFSESVSIFALQKRSSRHTKDAIILVPAPCIFPFLKRFVTYNFCKETAFLNSRLISFGNPS